MPFDQVMHKFKQGKLHSGSANGPVVTNPKQAVAIRMSEQRQAAAGKTEYQSAAKPKPKKPAKKPNPRGFASLGGK